MKRITLSIAAVTLPLAAFTTADAKAGALAAANIFGQFDAVIFGNFSSTSDVEGRTVVGGDLTGGATFANKASGLAVSPFAALTT